jgi:hypothetical protein
VRSVARPLADPLRWHNRGMSRLPLGQVTLCAVDTRAPALAAQALLRSMEHVDFGRVYLFTHDWLPAVVLPGIEIVDIEPIRSGAEYSHFVLRLLPGYIRTSHVLVTQWDGFVVHPEAWTDEFLVYDYVGAVWPDEPDDCNVGNGGFSLRSRRLLLAGQDMRIKQEHPEDVVLCRSHRNFLEQTHGVRFAPARLARRFSVENELTMGISFGFHGPYNLPGVLDEPTLNEWLQRLPNEFFLSRDARRLARAMLMHGMPDAAQRLLQRRKAAGRSDPNTRLLGAAASIMGMLSHRAT